MPDNTNYTISKISDLPKGWKDAFVPSRGGAAAVNSFLQWLRGDKNLSKTAWQVFRQKGLIAGDQTSAYLTERGIEAIEDEEFWMDRDTVVAATEPPVETVKPAEPAAETAGTPRPKRQRLVADIGQPVKITAVQSQGADGANTDPANIGRTGKIVKINRQSYNVELDDGTVIRVKKDNLEAADKPAPKPEAAPAAETSGSGQSEPLDVLERIVADYSKQAAEKEARVEELKQKEEALKAELEQILAAKSGLAPETAEAPTIDIDAITAEVTRQLAAQTAKTAETTETTEDVSTDAIVEAVRAAMAETVAEVVPEVATAAAAAVAATQRERDPEAVAAAQRLKETAQRVNEKLADVGVEKLDLTKPVDTAKAAEAAKQKSGQSMRPPMSKEDQQVRGGERGPGSFSNTGRGARTASGGEQDMLARELMRMLGERFNVNIGLFGRGGKNPPAGMESTGTENDEAAKLQITASKAAVDRILTEQYGTTDVEDAVRIQVVRGMESKAGRAIDRIMRGVQAGRIDDLNLAPAEFELANQLVGYYAPGVTTTYGTLEPRTTGFETGESDAENRAPTAARTVWDFEAVGLGPDEDEEDVTPDELIAGEIADALQAADDTADATADMTDEEGEAVALPETPESQIDETGVEDENAYSENEDLMRQAMTLAAATGAVGAGRAGRRNAVDPNQLTYFDWANVLDYYTDPTLSNAEREQRRLRTENQRPQMQTGRVVGYAKGDEVVLREVADQNPAAYADWTPIYESVTTPSFEQAANYMLGVKPDPRQGTWIDTRFGREFVPNWAPTVQGPRVSPMYGPLAGVGNPNTPAVVEQMYQRMAEPGYTAPEYTAPRYPSVGGRFPAPAAAPAGFDSGLVRPEYGPPRPLDVVDAAGNLKYETGNPALLDVGQPRVSQIPSPVAMPGAVAPTGPLVMPNPPAPPTPAQLDVIEGYTPKTDFGLAGAATLGAALAGGAEDPFNRWRADPTPPYTPVGQTTPMLDGNPLNTSRQPDVRVATAASTPPPTAAPTPQVATSASSASPTRPVMERIVPRSPFATPETPVTLGTRAANQVVDDIDVAGQAAQDRLRNIRLGLEAQAPGGPTGPTGPTGGEAARQAGRNRLADLANRLGVPPSPGTPPPPGTPFNYGDELASFENRMAQINSRIGTPPGGPTGGGPSVAGPMTGRLAGGPSFADRILRGGYTPEALRARMYGPGPGTVPGAGPYKPPIGALKGAKAGAFRFAGPAIAGGIANFVGSRINTPYRPDEEGFDLTDVGQGLESGGTALGLGSIAAGLATGAGLIGTGPAGWALAAGTGLAALYGALQGKKTPDQRIDAVGGALGLDPEMSTTYKNVISAMRESGASDEEVAAMTSQFTQQMISDYQLNRQAATSSTTMSPTQQMALQRDYYQTIQNITADANRYTDAAYAQLGFDPNTMVAQYAGTSNEPFARSLAAIRANAAEYGTAAANQALREPFADYYEYLQSQRMGGYGTAAASQTDLLNALNQQAGYATMAGG